VDVREVCQRCRRPVVACYCAHITPIETKTRVVVLQHPRERDVPIGTARMASLCLPNSELHVGVDWSDSKPLARALSDASRPPILLYPGEGARDVVRDPPPGPVTLVVVDGTWWNTRTLVRDNPVLHALPRYAFVPPRPSEYRIRAEPSLSCVATIEALVHALTALEGDGEDTTRFERLLDPFRAMVDFQLSCQSRFNNARSRHTKRSAKPRVRRVPEELLGTGIGAGREPLCVVAEANAWPYERRAGTEATQDPMGEDELVFWAAHRPTTAETFTMIVKPRKALAPWTAVHTGIDEATLACGASEAELREAWSRFVRATDVVCTWGEYDAALFARAGGALPATRLDLRRVARDVSRGPIGTLGAYASRFSPEGSPLARGRAGHKLDALARIALGLRDFARA
jgi:DTW domain-containing protein